MRDQAARIAFQISVLPTVASCVGIIGLAGGPGLDPLSLGACVLLIFSLTFALTNLVQEKKVRATPFALLYFGAWAYCLLVFGSIVLRYVLNHPA